MLEKDNNETQNPTTKIRSLYIGPWYWSDGAPPAPVDDRSTKQPFPEAGEGQQQHLLAVESHVFVRYAQMGRNLLVFLWCSDKLQRAGMMFGRCIDVYAWYISVR